jgi:predicted HicB family RNase H-like nuclease
VGELTNEMLDEYLEFCHKALLAPEKCGKGRSYFHVRRTDDEMENTFWIIISP